MINVILIMAGASIGAVLRYATQMLVQSYFISTFPMHTLTVNVIGSTIIGLCVGSGLLNEWMSINARNFFIVGILSSYTTFSALIFDMYILIENRQFIVLAGYYLGTMLLSLLCFYVAILCAKFIFTT